jgi:hypothetical protein
MVDSCFKMFKKVKCFRKASIMTHRNSMDSIFQCDKNDNTLRSSKYSYATTVTSFDKIPCDNSCPNNHDIDNNQEVDQVILRRHHRPTYLRSLSTSDAMSSEDEMLDVLCPLPRVNTHERPLIEATNQHENGMKFHCKNNFLEIVIFTPLFTRFNTRCSIVV